MKRRTAFLLLLCGVPTPALWRGDKPRDRRVADPARQSAAPRTTVRVTVQPGPARQPARRPARADQPVSWWEQESSWLSDDPALREHVAYVFSDDPVAPTPPPPPRRPAARKTAPARPAGAPKTPRTKAERAADQRATWPSSWDALASDWDRAHG